MDNICLGNIYIYIMKMWYIGNIINSVVGRKIKALNVDKDVII